MREHPEGWTIEKVSNLPGAHLRIRRFHPKTAGIYFLLENGQLLYIGSSVNIQARMSLHRSSRRWPPGTEVRWVLFHRNLEAQMRELEHELIYCLKPPKNVTMNPASDKVQSYLSGNIRSIWVKNIIKRVSAVTPTAENR